jgi:hypothetical protein
MKTYGAWFITENEGHNLVIKRQIFDEFAVHSGYQLLEGDYDALAKYAIVGEAAVDKAIEVGKALPC